MLHVEILHMDVNLKGLNKIYYNFCNSEWNNLMRYQLLSQTPFVTSREVGPWGYCLYYGGLNSEGFQVIWSHIWTI